MGFLVPWAVGISLFGCAAAPSAPDPLRISPAPPDSFAVPKKELEKPAEVVRFGIALDDLVVEPLRSGNHLLELLKAMVAPGTWEADALSLDLDAGILRARHSPGALAAVGRLLSALRENRHRQIRASIHVYRLAADDLSVFENIPPAAGGLAGTFARQAIREALSNAGPRRRSSAPWQRLAAPQLLLVHGQAGNVRITNEMAYLAGYIQMEAGSDPRVDTASEGIRVDVRAVANGDRTDEFLADLSVEVVMLLEPPPQVLSVRLGAGPVELPGKVTARLHGRFTLRPDQVLFGVVRNPDVRDRECPLLGVMMALSWDP